MIKWNQVKLEKCVAFWQGVLGLQTWGITVGFERLNNLETSLGYPALARAISNPLMEEAIVSVLDPIDFELLDVASISGADLESSILHELLHLYFGDAFRNDKEEVNMQEELIINRTVKILLRGYGRVITK